MNIKILSLVSVLSWCAAAKASQDGSKVLVTMDGKPLITQQQLDQAFDRSGFLNKGEFLEEMVQREVVNKYIHDHKMDTSPEYLQKLQNLNDEAKTDLNLAYHAQALNIPIDRSEVANKYISDHKIDTSPNYQQQLKQRMDDAKSYLNLRTFDNLIPAALSASDSDIDRKNHRDKVDAEIERLKKEYKIVVVK